MPNNRQHTSLHAHMHAQTRTRERRQRLAHEAARLMAEGGIRDYHQAKLKAAQRLGIHDDASLPRNREIEDALREHQRLFAPSDHASELRRRREAALRALEFFRDFEPRLVGPVLDGSADANTAVALHVHDDDADAIPRWLDEHGVPAQARSRHLRLDRSREGDFPVWLFSAEELGFDVTVLPADVLRQAPLSAIDGRPMRRASATQLRALLAEDEIAGYEASRDSGQQAP
jgi:hypothetical protein